jgi:hypothetical protein
MNTLMRFAAAFALAVVAACGGGSEPAKIVEAPAATARATCGPGSRPETGLQGRVSAAEHESGRAAEGYSCNAEVVGAYTIPNAYGTVGGFKVERYVDKAGRECAYYDTTLVYPLNVFDGEAGVNVMDMSNPANPVLSERLLSPAMLSPHESLVVSQERGILAAVTGNPALYPGQIDVYDVSEDCRHPVLKASAPVGTIGHESGMAPDGRTFYSASPGSHTLTAVDLSNPMAPTPIAVMPYATHGLSISDDGNRAYLAGVGLSGGACAFDVTCAVPDPTLDRALVILDVSQIQARVPGAQAREIARLAWSPISIPQNAIPFTRNGREYLVEIDEFGRDGQVGAARIIDITDETKPVVVSDLRLEVHNPEHFAEIAGDPGADFVGQGYAGHYCNVPTRDNPDIVACSMIISGLRVFDIRDVRRPREVAYFNAPLNPRIVPMPTESSHYAMASPAFAPERREIWYTDVYSGFYVVRLTNGAWPQPRS